MATNEPFREISLLCELDSTRLSNIYVCPPYSGAKWIRGAKFVTSMPLKSRRKLARLSPSQIEGETAAPAILSTPNRLEKLLCEKKLAGLLKQTAARPTSFYTRRVDS